MRTALSSLLHAFSFVTLCFFSACFCKTTWLEYSICRVFLLLVLSTSASSVDWVDFFPTHAEEIFPMCQSFPCILPYKQLNCSLQKQAQSCSTADNSPASLQMMVVTEHHMVPLMTTPQLHNSFPLSCMMLGRNSVQSALSTAQHARDYRSESQYLYILYVGYYVRW
jgi:hypothetical protein